MTAGEYCNREVVITEQDASIEQAAILMREYHVGSIVVVEKQGELTIPIGILTDRDLVIEVIAEMVRLDSVTVKDVMTTDLVMVEESVTLIDTLQRMLKAGVRRVPVVNNQRSLQGILAADDVIELIAESISDLAKMVNNEIKQEANKRS